MSLHHSLQHLIQTLATIDTVMPFGATVAGDVFQCKLDQCFGHVLHVIVIADDIMVVGKIQNHRDHDQALTTLLHTARACKNQVEL